MSPLLALCRAALLPWVCCAVPAGASQGALNNDLHGLLQQQQIAGAVVATVSGARTDLLALGVFHSGTRQPLQPEHRVQVGSIAKTVLALAVLRLVTQGRVDLDAPLATLLPTVQFDNPWAARSPVRLRHLLDMTSGLPDVQLWHVFNQTHSARQPLALALRAEHGPVRLRSEPGRQFSYSNLGFTLAGMVIEAVTGERYEAWVARELLQPLGMRRSTFEFRRQGEDTELAWGHLDNGQPVADWPVAVRPAAHFTATAADMARLMRFLLGDGRLDGQPFVHTHLMAGLGQPSTTAEAQAGLRTGYGLGLFTRDRHGAVGLCHGGSAAGWRTMFCIYRATRQGYFIALNSDREDANHGLFDGRLVQHLGLVRPPAAADREALPAPASHAAWNGIYVPAPGRMEALALPDRLLSFWWLDLAAGRPTVREGLGPTRTLVWVGQGLYRQADRQQATLVLMRDAEGGLQVGNGQLSLRRVGLGPQGLLWTSAALGLLALLALLPTALWRWRRDGLRTASARVPAAWALLALVVALGAWALQGWQHMGEFTPVAVAVALASLVWPLACGLQLVRAWRHRQARRGRAWDALLALACLQLCALLAAFGWLPLLPWRV